MFEVVLFNNEAECICREQAETAVVALRLCDKKRNMQNNYSEDGDPTFYWMIDTTDENLEHKEEINNFNSGIKVLVAKDRIAWPCGFIQVR